MNKNIDISVSTDMNVNDNNNLNRIMENYEIDPKTFKNNNLKNLETDWIRNIIINTCNSTNFKFSLNDSTNDRTIFIYLDDSNDIKQFEKLFVMNIYSNINNYIEKTLNDNPLHYNRIIAIETNFGDDWISFSY